MNARARSLAAVICGLLAITGCESMRGDRGKAPALKLPVELALPGTMVVYMPKIISVAKQQNGDPIYMNWATALMDYVDQSSFVQRIIDRGRILNASTHISSKTIPSSDYSVLLVGAEGRAVHVQEPWQSVELFMLLDEYLRGKGSAKKLPPGCEAVRVIVRQESEDAAKPSGTPTGNAPVKKNPARPAVEKANKPAA